MPFNLVDICIVLLLVGACIRGFQIGLLRQAFSTVGFLLGLYPGVFLASFVMAHVGEPVRPLAGLLAVLSICFMGMSVGERLAVRLKVALTNNLFHKVDNAFGSIISAVTLLLGLWIAASLFALAPSSSFQNQVKNSVILSGLISRLPPVSSSLSTLAQFIDPSQSPQVFVGREPYPDARQTLPSPRNYQAILSHAQNSIVKIEGFGCGGIVDGSGFVYDKNLVLTNAHVVAGVKNPKVRSDRSTYNTTVVLFDPANDIAVLAVPALLAPALPLQTEISRASTSVFALGFPGGGTYGTSPGVILETFNAIGQDIYGKTRTNRLVYSVQTTVVRGNSGGPLIAIDGKVVGVVFATSTTYNNVGYALTISQIHDTLKTVTAQTRAVETGACSP
jgi:S1-C subfamily serine protease